MPTAKQLRHARSQPPLPVPGAAATRIIPFPRPLNREHALRFVPNQKTSWHTIVTGVFRIRAEIVERLAICAGAAFPNFLLAVIAWVIAEFLAGCAAYGQALYCTPMILDDCEHLRDPQPCARRDIGPSRCSIGAAVGRKG